MRISTDWENNMHMDREEAKKNGESLKRILKVIIMNYPFHIIISVIGIFISSFATVQGTAFTRTLVDQYITPMIGSTNPDFGPLFSAIMKVAAIYLIGIIASTAMVRAMVYVSQGSMRKIRSELFAHMQRLPICYFDTHAHGDIMSVYTNDIDTLRDMIGQSLPQGLQAATQIVSVFVTMLMLNIPMTILAFAMVGVMLVSSRYVMGFSGTYFMKQQNSIGKLNGYVEEMISGQKVIKVFTHEKQAIEEFEKWNEELRENAFQANNFANILMPIIAQIGNISYVICAIAGGMLALNGSFGITVGTMIAFLTLLRGFNQPFAQVSQQLNAIVRASAGARRIYELHDAMPEEDDGYVTLVNCREENGVIFECEERTGIWAWKHFHASDNSVTYTRLEGNIVFEDVDFGYVPEKTVLHEINLYADKGQKVAFVGSTGAGKTTITNLINRFYDISAGKIRYDGINIGKIKKDDLRKSLGVVLQETHLFTGTVLENIRYGRESATDEECMAAAKLANANGFIERLPNGYHTVISADGGKLSQGQRQLIAIARAAVADPPVLILDEATSSIDTRTEQLVQRGMDALMGGRTTFVIAHRLSTVKNADCIMVLEAGRIIERGSHDDLLSQKGKYHQLYMGV